jgi:putative redox protein
MPVEIDIEYQGDLHCAAKHVPSGNALVTDAPKDNGGRGEAFSPTDLVATALGTCMVTIMGLVAKRDGLDLKGTRIRVLKDMVADPVRRIGTLTVTVTLPKGRAFSSTDRRKLDAAAKTCPVKQSLHPDVNVKVEFVYPE